MTKQDLINIGFEEIPHKTITGSIIYRLPRGRELSLACFATPNEMLALKQMAKDGIVCDSIIVLSNYDYDGYVTMDKIKSIIHGITGEVPKVKKEKVNCYEVHRPNIPQYGCETQCNACKEIEEQKRNNNES